MVNLAYDGNYARKAQVKYNGDRAQIWSCLLRIFPKITRITCSVNINCNSECNQVVKLSVVSALSASVLSVFLWTVFRYENICFSSYFRTCNDREQLWKPRNSQEQYLYASDPVSWRTDHDTSQSIQSLISYEGHQFVRISDSLLSPMTKLFCEDTNGCSHHLPWEKIREHDSAYDNRSGSTSRTTGTKISLGHDSCTKCNRLCTRSGSIHGQQIVEG